LKKLCCKYHIWKMGICHYPPMLDDNYLEDDTHFSGRSISTMRNSKVNKSKWLVKNKHRESLKKCHGILHNLAQCTKRGKNWNHLINKIIDQLEEIKFKTVAQETSDWAKELLFDALTKGTEEDKEIGNHFQQLTKPRESVLSVRKWVLQPEFEESSRFSEKLNPDISLTGTENTETKDMTNVLVKYEISRPSFPTTCFDLLQPPEYIEQFPGLKNILSWNFDLFGFSMETNKRPLSTMFMYMCSQLNIETGIVGINISKLSSFIQEVESKYGDNPYHNYLHGADVLHSSFNFLQRISLLQNLDLFNRFSLLFASAIHDFSHPGVGNDFLVKTGSKIATTYNDTSVLENWHTSQAFSLLRKSEFNFLENVDGATKAIIRGNTIESVLMTDMKRHDEHVKQLQEFIEKEESTSTLIDPVKLISYALHVSDLSHPTKKFDIHMEWSTRLTREFLEQGDKEIELGMEPGALFDRRKANMEKGQIGFINFIILPLWINWTSFIGAEEEWIQQIHLNKEEWQRRASVELQENESQSSSPLDPETGENKLSETLREDHHSTRGKAQKTKPSERQDTNSRLCQTLRKAKHQDLMYSKGYGNDGLRFFSLEEAALPTNERKSSFNTSSNPDTTNQIKSSHWQLCSRGQSVDSDGIPVILNLQSKRSLKSERLSNCAHTFGESGVDYLKESQEFVQPLHRKSSVKVKSVAETDCIETNSSKLDNTQCLYPSII